MAAPSAPEFPSTLQQSGSQDPGPGRAKASSLPALYVVPALDPCTFAQLTVEFAKLWESEGVGGF